MKMYPSCHFDHENNQNIIISNGQSASIKTHPGDNRLEGAQDDLAIRTLPWSWKCRGFEGTQAPAETLLAICLALEAEGAAYRFRREAATRLRHDADLEASSAH